MSVDLIAENRALRDRVAELERGPNGIDPWLRALVEHLPAFINVITPEGRFLATGRTSEGFGTVVGRSVYEFTDAASHEEMRAALAKACATGSPVSYEVTAFGEDGTPGHVYHVRAIPLDKDGKTEALVLVPTDISERVKLERAVLEKEAALRFAVGATRMGLWRWDIPENRVHWDDRILEIWGLTESPLSYESYREFIHPEDRGRVEAAIRHALETGHYPTLEHRIFRGPEGHVRFILAVGTVIKDSHGKPVRLMGGVLDITERKHLEAQLLRATRVEAIGQLTAGIAHNFNNLLTIIIPNVELAMVDPSANRQGLSTALNAALQAREVVKSLLALARNRAEEGGTSEPRQVIERAVSICRATFPREIDLTCHLGDAGTVPMPATALEQVLLNLLLNARDALEEVGAAHLGRAAREVRIDVDRASFDGTSWVRIRVRDNGAGMTPEVRARMFEPFFSTKPPHRGSGLGLANVLLRVQQAGGRLDCVTALGEGSTFEIVLPEVHVAPVSAGEAGATPSKKGQQETILVVDDEPNVRNAVRRVLEMDGYAVVEASSAAEARELLGTERGRAVELIVLDQSMPAQSGTEALPSIRALTPAPVILFSGMLPERVDGFAAVLEKPPRPAELWRIVRKLLDERNRG